jgi:hypothetical protein
MREVHLQKLGIYEVKASDLTEDYVLDILKRHSMSEIRKSYTTRRHSPRTKKSI